MQKEKIKGSLKVFSSIYAMVFAAVLIAVSVTGKFFAINIGITLRISYENLPIVIAGIALGPFVGFLVGVGADLCGCIALGYSINPIIMLGAGMIGLVSGFVSMAFKNRFSPVSLIISDLLSHITGSLIIKTIGIVVFYGAENGIWALLWSRVVTYVPVVIFEIIILLLLFSSKLLQKEFNKLLR